MTKGLLISAFAVFLAFAGLSQGESESGCQSMDVTVTVSSAGNNAGVIEILAPTDAKLKVYLLNTENSKPPVEVTLVDGKVRNVAIGQYDLILQDTGKKYCNVLRRLTIN